jgi:hypothetical protein
MKKDYFWNGKKLFTITFYSLTFEFESLQKVEMEQKTTIEKLSNNES